MYRECAEQEDYGTYYCEVSSNSGLGKQVSKPAEVKKAWEDTQECTAGKSRQQLDQFNGWSHQGLLHIDNPKLLTVVSP